MPASRAEEKNAAQGEMFFNRLRKRFRHLKKWARRTGTDAFRLYDRDIPEIPLVLDIYGDAVSGALYKRPYEKDPSEEERWLNVMRDAAARALEIPVANIFLKVRDRQRGTSQYGKFLDQSVTRDVSEGGLRFRVNLSDYLDTGLFPDRRKMRALVREEAAGKRTLNLFCYTAAFSVYAAAGGALSVDSVDLSNTYLDRAMVNFSLNRFAAKMIRDREFSPRAAREKGGPSCTLIRGDALRFMAEAQRAGLTWDLIILDPPAFSNSKGMSAALDLQRDHRELISRCLELLAGGGKLWFSANPRQFRLDVPEFPGITIRDMGSQICDEDFRGRKIPLCYTFTRLPARGSLRGGFGHGGDVFGGNVGKYGLVTRGDDEIGAEDVF
jgi:23S rRNA G2069 N7-methylase RlmK/C1962 C5-methylase RlmI